MFEDSLIDARIKTRRGATTAVSFVLQAILVGIVVLIPLLFTEALPAKQLVTTLVAPPPPPPPPPPAAHASAVREVEKAPVKSEITMPVRIPQKIAMIKEAPAASAAAPPSTVAGVVGGVPGGVPGGTVGGVVGGVLNSIGSALPAPKRVKVSSGVTEGLLIRKVMPEYPAQAKAARMQGTVVLAAVIGKDGAVKDLHVVSGPPLLAQSAMTAVKQWRYKPYFLNGQATEVDTTINVNFKLGAAS